MTSTTGWMSVMLSIIGVLVLIGMHNRVLGLRQRRRNAFVDVDTQLKMRYDLVPTLVDAFKVRASGEKAVLEKVAAARTRAMQGGAIADRIEAEQGLSAALAGLFAAAENYPQLKTDANFRQLQADLSDVGNKIAASRRVFNKATTDYNNIITRFPGVMVARVLGLNEEPFFDIDAAGMQTAPAAPKAKTGT